MDEMQNPSDPADQLDPGLDTSLGRIELQDDLEGDTLREECGVFGIFGHPEAAAITALGLHAFSTAARKPPASSPSTAAVFTRSAGSAWSATPSPAAR